MSLPWPAIDEALEAANPARLSGRVTRVGGLLVEGYLPGARLGMMCRLQVSGRAGGVQAEVVALREGRVVLMPLEPVPGITIGSPIDPGRVDPTVGVSPAVVGRVLDGWGQPADGGPPIQFIQRYPVQPPPLNPMDRGLVDRPLSVGVRAVDALLTAGNGQRVVIMAGAGVGKSTLLGMMARNTDADVTVIALVGERSREVKHFVEVEMGPQGRARSVVVQATAGMSVAMRLRAARVAFTIAESFRDEGKRVLLLVDSFTRICMAQRELGLAIGEPPTTRGYPPSAFAIIPQLLERAGPGVGGGSITTFCTALLESDDLGDPIGDAIRAVTDGHIVLSRRLADQGHFPAIDVLASTSRVMTAVVGPAHRQAALTTRRVLADLREAEELLTLGAYTPGDTPRFDRALSFRGAFRDLLTQAPEDNADFRTARATLLKLAKRVADAERADGASLGPAGGGAGQGGAQAGDQTSGGPA